MANEKEARAFQSTHAYRTNERNYCKCLIRQEKIMDIISQGISSACLNCLTLSCIMLKNGQTHLKNQCEHRNNFQVCWPGYLE